MLRSKRLFYALVLAVLTVTGLKIVGRNVPGSYIEPVKLTHVRAGDSLLVTGRALDASHVKHIYLNDGHTDFPVQILHQEAGQVWLRVPSKTPAGHLRFVIMPTDHDYVMDEQVFLTVLPALEIGLV